MGNVTPTEEQNPTRDSQMFKENEDSSVRQIYVSGVASAWHQPSSVLGSEFILGLAGR